MKLIIGLLSALGVLAFAVPSASADPPEKGWICHGTGSESNPFVLLHVPLNSAHFTKHLPDGKDHVPNLSDPQQNPGPRNFTCGPEGSEPTPPFHGALTFSLDPAICAPGEIGVPGFTVIQTDEKKKKKPSELRWAKHKRGTAQVETVVDGEVVNEQVIFQYPFTCIPAIAGLQGPQGPAGPAGPTTKLAICKSRRVAHWILVVRSTVRVTNLRAAVEGVPTRAKRGRTRGGRVKYTVTVGLRGLTRNVYAARVRYRVDGRRNTKIHLFRVCTGNPKGGRAEHLNRFAITIL